MNGSARVLSLVFLACAALSCGSTVGEGGSATGEEFLETIKSALATREPGAISRLYCWDRIDSAARAEEEQRNLVLLKGPVKDVSFQALPEGFRAEFSRGGIRYYPNVSIVGRVKLVFVDSTVDPIRSLTISYAHDGERFCLPVMLQSRLADADGGPRELRIGIRSPADSPPNYEVTCSYIANGVSRDLRFQGAASRVVVVRGEFVRSCVARKNTSGGFIQLLIEEGGKPVFESERAETAEPIVYSSQ